MNGYRDPNYQTWKDWATAAGVIDQFSAQQLALAEADDDYGWATTSNKVGYGNATTPEQRAMYHAQQTELNRTKGFTGGTDGSLYDPSPTQQAQNSAKDAVTSFGTFDYSKAPDYQGVLDKVINYGPFSYDYKTDPSYQAYAKQYAREGRRASEDTMGQYAAMTGGRPSTAAMTASQQAGNYYASQMADKIPELYQQAYQRYLQEYQRQLSALDALNTDRNFEYGVYGDQYSRLLDQYNLAAGENADALARVEKAEQTAYDRGQAEDETAYQRQQDEYKRQLDEAKLIASQFGDYTRLAELLGIDASSMSPQQAQYILAGSGVTNEGNTVSEETAPRVAATTNRYMQAENTPDYKRVITDFDPQGRSVVQDTYASTPDAGHAYANISTLEQANSYLINHGIPKGSYQILTDSAFNRERTDPKSDAYGYSKYADYLRDYVAYIVSKYGG